MAEEKAPYDVKNTTLSNGVTFSIDLYKVTRREWRDFWKGNQTEEQDIAFVSKITGLSADELNGLPYPEFRRVVTAIFNAGRAPLDNPN